MAIHSIANVQEFRAPTRDSPSPGTTVGAKIHHSNNPDPLGLKQPFGGVDLQVQDVHSSDNSVV